MTPPMVLTVAGSDSGAGAGIQADLKVFASMRVYGASVITAITAQNTRGVHDVFPLPAAVVGTQLAAVLDDMPVAAVKVGMLATAETAGAVAARARAGALPNLVLDPVLTASSGRRLGVLAAIERLLPYATVVTPNREEASAMVGWQVATPADMAGAAGQIASAGPKCVVVTGGDMVTGEDSVDALWTESGARFLHYPRIATRNDHGTGCSFAAAIAARLALGDAPPAAIGHAKQYVARALAGARDWKLGAGRGPLDHFGWE
ncbi:MAG TPA: bifunctional hydroxymethylpyrimidine kinase/phosphomethylpyrimidine kinase [Pilimelia sp.]|nr:bifunctional hydroxymethylpyrimidine kinase/phosphomethylpyrimidine kinase [Pilimelia sp.]